MSVFEDLARSRRFDGPSPRNSDYLQIRHIALLVCASAGSIVAVVSVFVLNDLKWGVILNDPAAQFDLPAYAGLFTYASVIALVVAAAICLFARATGRLRDDEAVVLGLAGILSALLALDDLFLLHERFLRESLGLSELFVFAVYGAIGAAILWRLGPEVIGRRFAGLWLAACFLALMTLADKVEKTLGTPAWLYLTEETAKFCGFILWAAFWIAYSRVALRRG
jgi:hypothetical protein